MNFLDCPSNSITGLDKNRHFDWLFNSLKEFYLAKRTPRFTRWSHTMSDLPPSKSPIRWLCQFGWDLVTVKTTSFLHCSVRSVEVEASASLFFISFIHVPVNFSHFYKWLLWYQIIHTFMEHFLFMSPTRTTCSINDWMSHCQWTMDCQLCITISKCHCHSFWKICFPQSQPHPWIMSNSRKSHDAKSRCFCVRPQGSCSQTLDGWAFHLGLRWHLCASWRGEMNISPVATANRWPRLTHSPLRMTMTNKSWLWRGLQLRSCKQEVRT